MASEAKFLEVVDESRVRRMSCKRQKGFLVAFTFWPCDAHEFGLGNPHARARHPLPQPKDIRITGLQFLQFTPKGP